MLIQNFEPNIHPLKSKDMHPLCSQNQHQSPSQKPTNPSKHKIRSHLKTHRSPPSSKSHHSLEPTLWNHNPQILHRSVHQLWTQRMESPPSFCNGLGTIYIASFRGMTFWSYYQRYGFRVKVRSWECVRHPKPPNPKVGFLSLCLLS